MKKQSSSATARGVPASARGRALRALTLLAAGVFLPVSIAPQSSPVPRPVQAPAAPLDRAPRQQIAGECAQLLQLAVALKASVDKTSKDELSLVVVRRASEIERLARRIRAEMKPATEKGTGAQ